MAKKRKITPLKRERLIFKICLQGFTIIEMLVVIAIISLIAATAFVIFNPIRQEARDTKRKAELAQIGRFFSLTCYMPDAGAGEYDLAEIIDELKTNFPQSINLLGNITPVDPKTGDKDENRSNYFYEVTADGKHCVLYANLERNDEKATIPGITEPTPGLGNGVFESATVGWNGSNKYFQISN